MTIWHNLAGVAIGLLLIALGRLIIVKARRLADAEIDFEASSPLAPAWWGKERNRRIATLWNWVIGGFLAGSGTICVLISAGQFVYRVLH